MLDGTDVECFHCCRTFSWPVLVESRIQELRNSAGLKKMGYITLECWHLGVMSSQDSLDHGVEQCSFGYLEMTNVTIKPWLPTSWGWGRGRSLKDPNLDEEAS